jgi:hypothetical protein
MSVSAPPGMMQWVRSVDRRLDAAERARALFTGSGTPDLRPSYTDEDSSALTSQQGASSTPLWSRLTTTGPAIQLDGPARRVKVTVTAMVEGIRTDLNPASAVGVLKIEGMDADVPNASTLGDGPSKGGLVTSFVYPAGVTIQQQDMRSYSQVLMVPDGPYTVRSEYLYRHQTGNIRIRWSLRSMMVEPA